MTRSNILLLQKSLSFRVIVFTADLLALFLFFQIVHLAIVLGIVRHVIQTILYWVHERLWKEVRWGIKRGGDTWKKTLAKTGTFRLVAGINDFILIFLFVGSATLGIKGALLLALLNTAIYFLHERLWNAYEQHLLNFSLPFKKPTFFFRRARATVKKR